jgi:hypothetical protein
VQALALTVLLLTGAGLGAATRARLILITGASYAALFVILLGQALRGIPLTAPDPSTLTQLGVWAAASAIAAGLAVRGDALVTRHTAAV